MIVRTVTQSVGLQRQPWNGSLSRARHACLSLECRIALIQDAGSEIVLTSQLMLHIQIQIG